MFHVGTMIPLDKDQGVRYYHLYLSALLINENYDRLWNENVTLVMMLLYCYLKREIIKLIPLYSAVNLTVRSMSGGMTINVC